MNGYNFTERVRKVLAMAREEAARLHHEYVGTEHILLGLIREGEGVAAAVLQNLSVDLDEIQQKIEDTVKKGKASQTTGPDLPYTSRAKKVLNLSPSTAAPARNSIPVKLIGIILKRSQALPLCPSLVTAIFIAPNKPARAWPQPVARP